MQSMRMEQSLEQTEILGQRGSNTVASALTRAMQAVTEENANPAIVASFDAGQNTNLPNTSPSRNQTTTPNTLSPTATTTTQISDNAIAADAIIDHCNVSPTPSTSKSAAAVIALDSSVEEVVAEEEDEQSRAADDVAAATGTSNTTIECPICLQTCIHPARLPCGHIFCFLCVKGVAYKNRRCAMCRREIPPEFLDHPDLVNGIDDICVTKSTEDGYQWFYEGRNGWWQYDDRTSQDIEEAFKKGEKSCIILVAGYVYVVDLEAMVQQRQNEPVRCRRVKRDLATIPKKGVAGLSIEGNTVITDSNFASQVQQQQQRNIIIGISAANTPLDPTSDFSPPLNFYSLRHPTNASDFITTIAATDAAIRIASDIIGSTLAHADELSRNTGGGGVLGITALFFNWSGINVFTYTYALTPHMMHPSSEQIYRSRQDLEKSTELSLSQNVLPLVRSHHGSAANIYQDQAEDFRRSMACIQDGLEQMRIGAGNLSYATDIDFRRPQVDNNVTDSSSDNTCQHRWTPTHGYRDKGFGVMTSLLGCMKPILSFMTKSGVIEIKDPKDYAWEIPFECITGLEWLGSGAQGAVFSGKLNNEIVAVKKVKELKETDIKHLRKLDHQNIIKFKGVCTQPPVYCIIMEFCPYGPLQNILKEEKIMLPSRLVSWSKQIAHGMQYLHSHKIIHRDLKSPNILIGQHEIVKISDFGTSKEWNEISTKMSFAGTVAWMAPEVIRNEPCSEKVDIWSYGVVLWEMLTCEIPYKDVDSSAIIWGVGNNSLKLPIPSSCPEGFKLLVNLCWHTKPRNRPSFGQILTHLEIAGPELLRKSDKVYFEAQQSWKEEVRSHLKEITQNGTSIHKYEQDLIRRRTAEWQHAQDIRLVYEDKLEKTNRLYLELSECMTQLQEKEKEIAMREKQLPGYKPTRRLGCTLRKIQNYRRRLNPPMVIPGNAQQKQQSSTPDPETTPESPLKAMLYAQVIGLNQTKSYCVTTQKPKKSRHRRVGSGSFAAAPKYSPNRDRRYQSEPENRRNVKLVDTETQTDAMDISETDISPNGCCAMRDISMALSPDVGLPSYEVLYGMERIQECQLALPQTALQCSTSQPLQLQQPQLLREQQQQTDVPSETAITTPMSLNGNSMTPSDVTLQDACSSPDQLEIDDVINSNERLDIPNYCSSNEHLERLGEKVIKFINENRLSIQTTTSLSNQGEPATRLQVDNGNEHVTASGGSSTLTHTQERKREGSMERTASRLSGSMRRKQQQQQQQQLALDKPVVTESQTQAHNNANVESNEDLFDDSWSDEEGEEDTDYNYSLRRRSIGRLPIGRGMRARRCYKIPITPKIPIHKRNVTVVSDEENTSEYSHSPSSQHSTLESNPDEVLKQMQATQKSDAMNATSTDSEGEEDISSSSSSDEAENAELERRTTITPSTQRPRREQRQQQQQKQNYITARARATNVLASTSCNIQPMHFLQKSSDVISIPTFEADGAVDMV
ncbi:uncharacterized protein wnd isoform X1 [Eurosta solidaginis]|uniref:uncharacterized protein wnd isoform X1 n=1 Tax=Eurosta solidaginis TaxID=178769 RepID=UPI003530F21A